ncbi:MAG: rRNA pseudouridine2604 synthase, partial [Patescibacteria group bacterium]|nr:rRNA pseudouridine2604 synthase [Patescibacteria group bacterium]
DVTKLPYLEAGIMEEGELLTAKSVRITSKNTLTIVLTEGKKHQIRRMLSAIHLTVIALKRVRIMNVLIGAMNPGQSRPISGAARTAFLADLGLE